jgi:hypothetical protein
MKTLVFVTLSFVWNLLTGPVHLFAQATSELSVESALKVDIVLLSGELTPVPNTLAKFKCDIVGPAIPNTGKKTFVIQLKNSTETTIQFEEIKTFCNCINLRYAKKDILPGDTFELSVDFHMSKSRSGSYSLGANFILENDLKGVCRVTGQLENTLVILGSQVYESNGAISVWEIPVLSTPPVDPARLKVELGNSLRDLQAKMVLNENKALIEVTGPEASLGLAGITGDIIVTDSEIGVKSTSRVTFTKSPVIRISPLFVTFTPKSDTIDQYRATFLVHATKKKPSATNLSSEGASEGPPHEQANQILNIGCTCASHSIINIERIGIRDDLFRVNVIVKKSTESDKEEFDLDWDISSTNGNLSVSSRCLFQELEK